MRRYVYLGICRSNLLASALRVYLLARLTDRNMPPDSHSLIKPSRNQFAHFFFAIYSNVLSENGFKIVLAFTLPLDLPLLRVGAPPPRCIIHLHLLIWEWERHPLRIIKSFISRPSEVISVHLKILKHWVLLILLYFASYRTPLCFIPQSSIVLSCPYSIHTPQLSIPKCPPSPVSIDGRLSDLAHASYIGPVRCAIQGHTF